jgi:hypothetical protein
MRSICHVQSIKKMFVESIPLMGGIDPPRESRQEREKGPGREGGKRRRKKPTDIFIYIGRRGWGTRVKSFINLCAAALCANKGTPLGCLYEFA